ncbi:MAG: type I restriction enzyme endonuclease domain-containing protein, partial [bacterium]
KYLSLARNVDRLYKAILPDPVANEYSPKRALFTVIAEKIRNLTPEPDISEVMEEVEKLLDESIAAEGYVIRDVVDALGKSSVADLSEIDFDALKKHFEKSRKRIEAEKLKGSINAKLKKMVRLNRTRMDYLQRFQKLIDEYNAGALNIDLFFVRLVAFARELNAEDKRHIAEKLNQEELALFDLLTKSEIKLTKAERNKVKKVAKDLLKTLHHEKLVLDWRKRQQTRAAVRLCVEEILDQLPKKFTKELYLQKCEVVYQHVYESYYGAGRSVYALAA